MRSFVTI